jgi:hypothetical protein
LRRQNVKSDEENFKSMDSTFPPIGKADSRARRFWPSHLKSKIYEVEEIKDFKNSKFEEVEDI